MTLRIYQDVTFMYGAPVTPCTAEHNYEMTYEAIEVIRKNAVAAEREACAEVVENWNSWPPSPKQIAAAIRARKDRP